MKLKIASRSGKQLATINLPASQPTLHDLQLAFASQLPRFPPSRQLFTVDQAQSSALPARLDDPEKRLSEYGVQDGDCLLFKDLGPQIGWKTVFFLEYLGPLLLHPLIYWQWAGLFGWSPLFQSTSGDRKHTAIQQLVLYLTVLHFVKRELETLLVHRFSHGTMPLKNLFKNSFHYWILSGVLLAWECYSPQFAASTVGETISIKHYAIISVWLWAELSNLSTHLTLRNLRPPGKRSYWSLLKQKLTMMSCAQAPKYERYRSVMGSMGRSIYRVPITFSKLSRG